MGHLGAKEHSLCSPLFMPLYQRPSVFPLFFTAAITCPIFSSYRPESGETGSVRMPASWCRFQGPEDLGNWHRVECLWWFLLVKQSQLKITRLRGIFPLPVQASIWSHTVQEQLQPGIISSSQHDHLHHLSSLGLRSVLSISKGARTSTCYSFSSQLPSPICSSR